MVLFRRSTLWVGCGLLACSFMGAERLAGRAAAAGHDVGASVRPAVTSVAFGQQSSETLTPAEAKLGPALVLVRPEIEAGAKGRATRGTAEGTGLAVRNRAEPQSGAAGKTTRSASTNRAGSADNKAQRAGAEKKSGRKIRRVCRVTAYCDRGLTAAGTSAGVGQCAAPGDIPFGTEVHIPALGKTLVATDRTHRRFRHNTVDIFIPSKQKCRNFGRKYLEVEFTVPEDPPGYGELKLPHRMG